jgi:hypothetical protein
MPPSPHTGPGIRGDLLRRVAALLGRVPRTDGGYRDPLFERPDRVEDDYYRFRNQPHDNRAVRCIR